MDKTRSEKAFAEEITPLLDQLGNVCERFDIDFLSVFALGDDGSGSGELFETVVCVTGDEDGKEIPFVLQRCLDAITDATDETVAKEPRQLGQ